MRKLIVTYQFLNAATKTSLNSYIKPTKQNKFVGAIKHLQTNLVYRRNRLTLLQKKTRKSQQKSYQHNDCGSRWHVVIEFLFAWWKWIILSNDFVVFVIWTKNFAVKLIELCFTTAKCSVISNISEKYATKSLCHNVLILQTLKLLLEHKWPVFSILWFFFSK